MLGGVGFRSRGLSDEWLKPDNGTIESRQRQEVQMAQEVQTQEVRQRACIWAPDISDFP